MQTIRDIQQLLHVVSGILALYTLQESQLRYDFTGSGTLGLLNKTLLGLLLIKSLLNIDKTYYNIILEINIIFYFILKLFVLYLDTCEVIDNGYKRLHLTLKA